MSETGKELTLRLTYTQLMAASAFLDFYRQDDGEFAGLPYPEEIDAIRRLSGNEENFDTGLTIQVAHSLPDRGRGVLAYLNVRFERMFPEQIGHTPDRQIPGGWEPYRATHVLRGPKREYQRREFWVLHDRAFDQLPMFFVEKGHEKEALADASQPDLRYCLAYEKMGRRIGLEDT